MYIVTYFLKNVNQIKKKSEVIHNQGRELYIFHKKKLACKFILLILRVDISKKKSYNITRGWIT